VVEAIASSVDPALLERMLGESEGLDAALSAAVEVGARTGLASKRRLLGRVIAQATIDSARVDEATLIVGVLGQVDAPHIRCLAVIHEAEVQARDAGEIAIRAEGAERELNERITEAGKGQPQPVLTALASLGLLETSATWGGSMIVLGLTPFGEQLLDDLRELGDEPS